MATNPKCVLVDDDPTFLSFVRVCLRRICPQLEVETFGNGIDALSYLMRHHVDLLITDFRMPMSDGLELTADVRSSGADKDVPIVVMSGDDIETEALARGADEFLPKRDLAARIGSVLEHFGILPGRPESTPRSLRHPAG